MKNFKNNLHFGVLHIEMNNSHTLLSKKKLSDPYYNKRKHIQKHEEDKETIGKCQIFFIPNENSIELRF